VGSAKANSLLAFKRTNANIMIPPKAMASIKNLGNWEIIFDDASVLAYI
jgi:hypothetical protein